MLATTAVLTGDPAVWSWEVKGDGWRARCLIGVQAVSLTARGANRVVHRRIYGDEDQHRRCSLRKMGCDRQPWFWRATPAADRYCP